MRNFYLGLFLFTAFGVASLFGQVQDVPESLPETMRSKSASDMPNDLRQTDFFGRVKDPKLEAYDPYRSAFFVEGRDTVAEQLPDGQVLQDLSHRYVVRYGSLPTIAVTSGRAVSVLLMRNGKIIVPKFAGIVPPPEGMVQVIPVKGSPYLYFQARDNPVFPGNFNYTHVFIPMDLEGRPIQFQIRLKLVKPDSDELVPLVLLDMVGDFPEVFDDAGSPAPVEGDGSNQPVPAQQQGQMQQPRAAQSSQASQGAVNDAMSQQHLPDYQFLGYGPTPVRPPFTREEVRKYFPTMIEMAKLYEQAVYDGAPGYTPKDIIRFRPKSMKDGKVISDKIPAFRNPVDGQVYFLPWGYYFPQYDAVVYELVFRNETSGDLWFDYALLKVLFGFDKPADTPPGGPKSAVVSPETYEVTPAGRYNTFWVLVQGHGIYPVTTPVRFLFPSSRSTDGGNGGSGGSLSYGEGRLAN